MRTLLLVLILSPRCYPLCPADQIPSSGGDRCVWKFNDGGNIDTEADVDGNIDGGPLNGGVIDVQTAPGLGCELFANGRVACWGGNSCGQHGAGYVGGNTAIQYVIAIPPALEIAVGREHACIRATDGVWCWGNNQYGRVDPRIGTTPPAAYTATPRRVRGPVLGIAAGAYHTCVIDDAYTATCWGDNSAGAFGNGSLTATAWNVTLVGLAFEADAVWAAGTRTCYRDRATRLIYCSGYPNAEGLVDGVLMPAEISGTGASVPSTDVSQGSALGMDACMLEEGTHKIWCWGTDYDMFPTPDT